MKKTLLSISLISLMMLSNSACVPLLAGSSVATGVVLAKDKSAGEVVDDISIKTKINERFFRKDVNNLFAKIHVEVSQGRVLLTGSVDDQETRLKAVRIVWKVRGVKEVINELEVAQRTDKIAIREYATDTWITTQIKTKLLFNKDIKSFNYNIETIRGVVYIIGVTKSQKELDYVTAIASQTRNVSKVVSYVKVVSSDDYSYENEASQDRPVKQHKVEKIKAQELKPLPAPKVKEVPAAPIETGIEDLDEFDD